MRSGSHGTSRRSTGGPRSAGFTLVEVVVAIGLLAVVTVIIAGVFTSVGETVTRGKRVSDLNRFAARLERLMREDFSSMIRQGGFMVVRNELTNTYTGARPQARDVPLTPDDTTDEDGNGRAGRARRIDELMFFARGEFTSRRSSPHPDLIVKSGEARVYYGHGQRLPEFAPGEANYERYRRPRLDEPNNFVGARLGEPSPAGFDNPNEYASDWTLLRHVTLLVPPAPAAKPLPNRVLGLTPPTNPNDFARLADHTRQIGGSPAAQSLFHRLAGMEAREAGLAPPAGLREADTDVSALGSEPERDVAPLFMSGLVDVAATTLQEVTGWVVAPSFDTDGLGGPMAGFLVTPADIGQPDLTGARTPRLTFDAAASPSVVADADLSPAAAFRQLPQRWMLEALPSIPYDAAAANRTGFRMRYEPLPPDPRVGFDDGENLSDADLRRASYEYADQQVLSSAVFAPRCTEFVVEFSFGITDLRTAGTNGAGFARPVWHGLRRFADIDASNTYTRNRDVLLADRLYTPNGQIPTYDNTRLERRNTTAPGFDIPNDPELLPSTADAESITQATGTGESLSVRAAELVDFRRSQQQPTPTDVIAEYCFGVADPGADPASTVDAAWPWPKLVRVTIRLADEADPTIEQTYEVTFRVPEAGER